MNQRSVNSFVRKYRKDVEGKETFIVERFRWILSFFLECSSVMILILTSLQTRIRLRIKRIKSVSSENFPPPTKLLAWPHAKWPALTFFPPCALAVIIITRDRLTVNWEKFMSFCGQRSKSRYRKLLNCVVERRELNAATATLLVAY